MLTATMTDMLPTAAFDTVADDGDHTLARLASRGDMPAFEALYRRHVGRVLGVITRLVGSHGARAEDLAQEACGRGRHCPRIVSRARSAHGCTGLQ